eukprot:gene26561-18328_t
MGSRAESFHLSIGSVRNRTEHLIDRIAAERFSWGHRNPELSNQGAGPPQAAQTNSTPPPTGAGAKLFPGDALTSSTRYVEAKLPGASPRRGTQERSSQAPEDQDPLAAARQYRTPMPGSRTPKHVVNQQMHAMHWQLQDALQDMACLSSLTCLASLATLSQCRVQAPLNPAPSSSLKGPQHGTQGFEQEDPSGRSSSQLYLNRPQAFPSRATWTADSHQPSPKSSQAKPISRYLGGTSINSAQQSSIRHVSQLNPGGVSINSAQQSSVRHVSLFNYG